MHVRREPEVYFHDQRAPARPARARATRLSDDPAENVKELAKAAAEVVKKFPAARR